MIDGEPQTEPTAEETVARATTELGAPDALFRASPRRQRAKFFTALGLLAFGTFVNTLWFVIGPGGFHHFLSHFLFLPFIVGTALLWQLWRHRDLRVLVYPTGVLALRRGDAESFPWDDITAVRFKLDIEGEPHVERDEDGAINSVWFATTAPAFQIWNVWIEIVRSDGVLARFNATLADFPELVERLQRGTFTHLRHQAQESLGRGEPAQFGKQFAATEDTLYSGKTSIAWSNMKPLLLTGRILSIKRKKSWTISVLRDTATIDNPHVFWAIAIEQGVIETDEV